MESNTCVMCSASIPTLFQYFFYDHIPTFFYTFTLLVQPSIDCFLPLPRLVSGFSTALAPVSRSVAGTSYSVTNTPMVSQQTPSFSQIESLVQSCVNGIADGFACTLQYRSPSHFFHCRRCAAPYWCDPQTQHLLRGEAAPAHWLEAGGQWRTLCKVTQCIQRV